MNNCSSKMNEDLKHLHLLSVFHFVVGGLSALFSLMPIFHIAIGLIFLISPETLTGESGEMPPAFIGYLFAIAGSIFLLLGLAFSACVIYSGVLLRRKQKYMFSLVVACIECMFMPFGTVLGIFTIIVLTRESVKLIYGRTSEPPDRAM